MLLKLVIAILLFPSLCFAKMDIGQNVSDFDYYVANPVFTDAMKQSGPFFTYTVGGSDWDSERIGEVSVDSDGYPLELPYDTDQGVRFLVNNWYPAGNYAILYDGTGTLGVGGCTGGTTGEGNKRIVIEGDGTNCWINISVSSVGDPITNMRIIPEAYEADEGSMPQFNSTYVNEIKKYKVLRTMDWTNTNTSAQYVEEWADRSPTTYYRYDPVPWEKIVEFANHVGTMDLWVCLPHKASDDFIDTWAAYLKNNLNSDINVYIEYSNEVWNSNQNVFDFMEANAAGHPNSYVSTAIAAIGAEGVNRPQKYAYMADRLFDRVYTVWSGSTDRIVRVAAWQAAGGSQSQTLLTYLFDTLSGAADALAIAPYFGEQVDLTQHNAWLSSPPSEQDVLDWMEPYITTAAGRVTTQKGYADARNISLICYEGGQHFLSYGYSHSWDYTSEFVGAQRNGTGDPSMYDLYMTYLSTIDDDVSLFVNFSFIGDWSAFGYWGTLEDIDDLSANPLIETAPKYKALRDYLYLSVPFRGVSIN